MEEKNQQTTNQNPQISDQKEQKKNTGMAILAYILFFIPLLTEAKKDPFVKYHIKQGILVFIGWVAVSIIGMVFPWYLGLGIIVRILNLAVFVLMIIGIINASQGQEKPLPLIGKFGEQFKI